MFIQASPRTRDRNHCRWLVGKSIWLLLHNFLSILLIAVVSLAPSCRRKGQSLRCTPNGYDLRHSDKWGHIPSWRHLDPWSLPINITSVSILSQRTGSSRWYIQILKNSHVLRATVKNRLLPPPPTRWCQEYASARQYILWGTAQIKCDTGGPYSWGSSVRVGIFLTGANASKVVLWCTRRKIYHLLQYNPYLCVSERNCENH